MDHGMGSKEEVYLKFVSSKFPTLWVRNNCSRLSNFEKFLIFRGIKVYVIIQPVKSSILLSRHFPFRLPVG